MDSSSTSDCIPIQLSVSKETDIRSGSLRRAEHVGSPGVKLWQSALKKIRCRTTSLDPWQDFDLGVPTVAAIRHRYNALKKKWIKDDIFVKLEQTPFDRGAMRECFRLKKVSDTGDWLSASNYVAKRYLSNVDSSVYFDDVRLQMEAKLWAEAFNRQNPPKKVDVFQMSVIEILHTSPMSPPSENKRRGSITTLNSTALKIGNCPASQFYHIERYMDGEYRKYNSNSGFVDKDLRNTPQAFSHFTFERSGHRLLVVDIQGVGDLYTDPQIHTADGLGYNDGNLGLRGMALFFHSHRCNPLCTWLGLSPFDLAGSEVAALEDVEFNDGERVDAESVCGDDTASEIDETDFIDLSLSPGADQQQLNNPLASFHLQPRKRSLSFGVIPSSAANANVNQSSWRHQKLLCGPTVVRDSDFLRAPRSRTLSGSVNSFVSVPPSVNLSYFQLDMSTAAQSTLANFAFDSEKSAASMHLWRQRQRQVSGDSGVAFHHQKSAGSPPLMNRRGSSITSADRFDDYSPLLPDVFQIGELNWCEDSNFDGGNLWKPQRSRIRTYSDCSDFDDSEGVCMATNSLHQVLHETHKPSSAAHPSNLDQEIGQSVLGQLHHELARMHEAGRFLKRPGGWSKTGLGGLMLRSRKNSTDEKGEKASSGSQSETIDWNAMLFHERHAAQLGCLEALIIMAHYYLGLPTQLLFECPIRPRVEDMALGMDYLWRSSEGGDRRCMILLARYLDASVLFGCEQLVDTSDRTTLRSVLNLTTTPVEDFQVLGMHTTFPLRFSPSPAVDGTPGPWTEAVAWYRRAIENARCVIPGSPASGGEDEGCDAEGRYDAAEDLWPVYRLLARMAEMYSVGGHGLTEDHTLAGDLFTQAAESVMQLMNGRLASKYFELAEEAYAKAE